MPGYVVFLRAVNVGKRQLKMADARKVLSDNDFGDVESHIQTGNFFLTSPLRSVAKLESHVGEVLSAHAGFDILAIARKPAELVALVQEVDGTPEKLKGETSRYVSFCSTAPTAAATRELHAQEVERERATVIGKDVLMEFAVPFNEAKLTGARVEKILGVPGTARNMTVVRALAQKWGA
ncbi:Uncharacterized conserved protein, DUF1697 family [Pedococcus dokdonensis]|uniref:Uncharacterized conserved protein, DUF1697 family n=1 Tax=Pedococcus dokdonensis TaxID=443156 RepID=A0A1H0NPK9_9MICO|nr:DUF1697 domain-containing protein [Pedococcus dokdonensis]SDO94300.1 Uncharacterized conserved protein, DUF1697 family [Pedococcus dokdonensis]